MRIYIGIDPGVHKHAIVATDGKGTNVGGFLQSKREDYVAEWATLMRYFNGFEEIILTIESQQFYRGQKGSVAADLINLAYETGRMYEKVHRVVCEDEYNLVLPNQWKGQVPKHIHNKRIIKKWGEVEPVLGKVPSGQMNHLTDALGLAVWPIT